jgi:hypothetical protein
VDSAGRAVGSVGKAIEKALFGDAEEAEPPSEKAPPDPFAKLKAAEAEKKKREGDERREAKERAATAKKLNRDVDAELAEMKKKLGK